MYQEILDDELVFFLYFKKLFNLSNIIKKKIKQFTEHLCNDFRYKMEIMKF